MAVGPKMKRGTAEPLPFEIRSDGNGYSAASLAERRGQHVHLDLAAVALAERDDAVGGGEQGVVAADADILAGVHLGAALADQDVARQDLLAAEALHAQPLAAGIAAVARGAACFLVCHRTAPVALLGDDLFDLDHRQVLTMTVLAPRVLAAALLEDDQVRPARLLDDRAHDLGAGNGRRADLVADHQHVGELDLGAGLARDALDR